MNHMLVLSFEYHRYNSDAIIRLYADDRLVDELRLNDDIKLKVYPDPSPAPGSLASHNQYDCTRLEIFPKKIFLYEIDEKYLGRSIRIEVINDNNNHTNGFMTQFSYLKFHYIFLVPCCFLRYDLWDRLHNFPGHDDQKNYFPVMPSMPRDIQVISSSAPWTCDLLHSRIGGSFIVDIPISKKHRTRHLGTIKAGKYVVRRSVFRILSRLDLLNINNEDQRSDITQD